MAHREDKIPERLKVSRANPPKQHLTDVELAERLDVSVMTVRGWRQTGRGPKFRKFSGACRYAIADVEEWELAATRTSTSDPGPQATTKRSSRQ